VRKRAHKDAGSGARTNNHTGGAHNSYGHPTPSTLAAPHAQVPHVYRTDQDGTVRLTVHGEAMSVATAR
jgi:competence protein ComEC